jgi:hypothetical protein
MPADNTRHLRAAASRRTTDTRKRAVKALRRLDTTGAPVNFDTVAREAGVSRSWLYAQTDLRTEIQRLRERQRTASSTPAVPDRQRATDTSLLRRLEAATERIRRLERDNRELREALAQALGEHRAANILGQPDRRDTPEKQTAQLIGPLLNQGPTRPTSQTHPRRIHPGQRHDRQDG